MQRNTFLLAALAVPFLASPARADPPTPAQQEIASVRYLLGTWSCAHTVGTFSGTYTTAYTLMLGDTWLKQTYDFPPEQMGESAQPVRAEFIMTYDAQMRAWVRFGALSTGQYFAIRMTDTADGWSWKYVSFRPARNPESPGIDATFTKKSATEYEVQGPSYEQNGTRVTEHHVCKKR
jgi:hypothetical protein